MSHCLQSSGLEPCVCAGILAALPGFLLAAHTKKAATAAGQNPCSSGDCNPPPMLMFASSICSLKAYSVHEAHCKYSHIACHDGFAIQRTLSQSSFPEPTNGQSLFWQPRMLAVLSCEAARRPSHKVACVGNCVVLRWADIVIMHAGTKQRLEYVVLRPSCLHLHSPADCHKLPMEYLTIALI